MIRVSSQTRSRIGVAVGATQLDTLLDTFTTLRKQHQRAGGRVVIALLPPLVRVRHIELPPLRQSDLWRVLTRDSELYWPNVQAAQVIAARRAPPLAGQRAGQIGYLVAAADAALVSAILDTARQAGWSRAAVVPAYAAWEQAGRAMGEGSLLVERPGVIEALRFRRGRLALIRRFRAVMPADQIRAALGDHTVASLDDPDGVAAAYAPRARGFDLVPEAVRMARSHHRRRWAAQICGCAAAVLLLAAGVELWGRQRELAALRAERAALARQVARAVTVREAIDGLERRLTMLRRAESTPLAWSRAIATVAEHLPANAYLVSLRGSDDTLVLDGVATRAATAFEALQHAPGISGVRAEAPIRQEARDSQPPIERFTLGARLAMAPATASPEGLPIRPMAPPAVSRQVAR